LKLEDLSRVPAETKAAVMQIVEKAKRRSGWRERWFRFFGQGCKWISVRAI